MNKNDNLFKLVVTAHDGNEYKFSHAVLSGRILPGGRRPTSWGKGARSVLQELAHGRSPPWTPHTRFRSGRCQIRLGPLVESARWSSCRTSWGELPCHSRLAHVYPEDWVCCHVRPRTWHLEERKFKSIILNYNILKVVFEKTNTEP